jgi:glutathione peroxidase
VADHAREGRVLTRAARLAPGATECQKTPMSTLHDFTAKTIDGKDQSLRQYAGKVALVVNVASQCGLTPHYGGLEELYESYKDRGLVVLGFPCNQFGGQEPGTEGEIKTFCETNFGVTFPMFAKIDVNGANAHPLYQWLKSEKAGLLGTEAIKWNFTKFLVDRSGHVVRRYAPTDTPAKIENDIAAVL